MSKTQPPVILCYHAVSAAWGTSLAVSPERFAAQLERFAERGFVGLTFAEAERSRQARTLPPRSLVITFDDAYASVAAVRPVLARLGYPATAFVVGDFLGSDRLLEWPGIDHWLQTEHRDELRSLSERQLREAAEDGWEIGSHTMTHPCLPDLDDEECLRELECSRELIAGRFESCVSIAYPYGRVDARVAALAARAGYAAGCSLTFSHRQDEPLRRPRVAVSGTDHRAREWAKMSPFSMRVRRTRLASVLSLLSP
jgi:peptidoglycan/xylan/chitin deacetylase (PgdA/CDA1 family)